MRCAASAAAASVAPVAPAVRHPLTCLLPRERAEYAANCARTRLGNAQLNLTDAVLTFSDNVPALDRVYQAALESEPTLQHTAVRQSLSALVRASHAPHHEVLYELTLQHPEEVFQNGTQRRTFEALCKVIDLPLSIVLPPPPHAAAAAAFHGAPSAQYTT